MNIAAGLRPASIAGHRGRGKALLPDRLPVQQPAIIDHVRWIEPGTFKELSPVNELEGDPPVSEIGTESIPFRARGSPDPATGGGPG
jgi:hypothetical protein